jgi:hypothetical protein
METSYNTLQFSSPVCYIVFDYYRKILTSTDVALVVDGGNIKDNYSKNGKQYEMLEKRK